MAMPQSGYPVELYAQYPERSSRGLALSAIIFFIKLIMLVPHLLVLSFLGLVVGFATFFGYLAVLFTGRYPRGLWDFALGFMRWNVRVNAWFTCLTDQYPPFRLGPGDYAVDIIAQYPERSSRGLAFLAVIFGLKSLLLVPHLFVISFLGIGGLLVGFVAYWIILFTGQYPDGMWRFVLGTQRWNLRVSAWMLGLTDQYPPFSLS